MPTDVCTCLNLLFAPRSMTKAPSALSKDRCGYYYERLYAACISCEEQFYDPRKGLAAALETVFGQPQAR